MNTCMVDVYSRLKENAMLIRLLPIFFSLRYYKVYFHIVCKDKIFYLSNCPQEHSLCRCMTPRNANSALSRTSLLKNAQLN